jgi:hypothetical protein
MQIDFENIVLNVDGGSQEGNADDEEGREANSEHFEKMRGIRLRQQQAAMSSVAQT